MEQEAKVRTIVLSEEAESWRRTIKRERRRLDWAGGFPVGFLNIGTRSERAAELRYAAMDRIRVAESKLSRYLMDEALKDEDR